MIFEIEMKYVSPVETLAEEQLSELMKSLMEIDNNINSEKLKHLKGYQIQSNEEFINVKVFFAGKSILQASEFAKMFVDDTHYDFDSREVSAELIEYTIVKASDEENTTVN